MTVRSRSAAGYAAVGAIVALAIAGAWLMRSGSPPRSSSAGVVVTTAAFPPPESAPVAQAEVPRPTAADTTLIGSWSRQDSRGSPAAACDARSVVTFDPAGKYRTSQPGSDLPVTGRYHVDGQTLTTWGRVTYDHDAEPIKDRYDEQLTRSLSASPPAGILIGSDHYYRCSLG